MSVKTYCDGCQREIASVVSAGTVKVSLTLGAHVAQGHLHGGPELDRCLALYLGRLQELAARGGLAAQVRDVARAVDAPLGGTR